MELCSRRTRRRTCERSSADAGAGDNFVLPAKEQGVMKINPSHAAQSQALGGNAASLLGSC